MADWVSHYKEEERRVNNEILNYIIDDIMKYPQLVTRPAAISNWLEEQFEARGVDPAVVYSHSVISFLQRDNDDVIHSQDDLLFSNLKEQANRLNNTRRRLRHSPEWWNQPIEDIEGLKRKAAIEYLRNSVVDKTICFDILIDELIAKLKDFDKAIQSAEQPTPIQNLESVQPVSPDELAERYYAAFPALPRDAEFVLPPPPAVSVWHNSMRPQQQQQLQHQYQQQQQHNHQYQLKDNTRNQSNNYSNNINHTNNNKNLKKKKRSNYEESLQLQMDRECAKNNILKCYLERHRVCRNSEGMKKWRPNMVTKPKQKDDVKVEVAALSQSDDRKRDQKDEEKMFEEQMSHVVESTLRLLNNSSPEPPVKVHTDETVKPEVRNWIKLYPISDPVWAFNTPSESKSELNPFCDVTYTNQTEWCNNLNRNDAGKTIDYTTDSGFVEATLDFDNTNPERRICESLEKLHHNAGSSAFVPVTPRSKSEVDEFASLKAPNVDPVIRRPTTTRSVSFGNVDSDDALANSSNYFRPIKEEHLDGATFPISNNFERVNYKRSESGTLYLENDYAMSKKYCEYRIGDDNKDADKVDLVPKFVICQNDIGCQTENKKDSLIGVGLQCVKQTKDDDSRSSVVFDGQSDSIAAGVAALAINGISAASTGAVRKTGGSISGSCQTPDSSAVELSWNVPAEQAAAAGTNGGSMWSPATNETTGSYSQWDSLKLHSIWTTDQETMIKSVHTPSTFEQNKMREELIQDGDQLLSDLTAAIQDATDGSPNTEEQQRTMTWPFQRRASSLLNSTTIEGMWDMNSESGVEEGCRIEMPTVLTTLSSISF